MDAMELEEESGTVRSAEDLEDACWAGEESCPDESCVSGSTQESLNWASDESDDDDELEPSLHQQKWQSEPFNLTRSHFYTCETLAHAEELKPAEIIGRIEAHTALFLSCLASGGIYQPALAKRTSDNRVLCDSRIRLGLSTTKKSFYAQPESYCRFWQVMQFVHKILSSQKHVTQREMYYCLLNSFTNQVELNRSVQDVAALLNCPRSNLGITASERGTIIGCVEWQEKGNAVNCRRLGSTGKLIPGNLSDIKDIRSEARFIIVVEKDAVFQRLAEDRIFDTLPSILITANMATRALLKRLQEEFHLPVIGLFDWNPGGVGVYITYRYGSLAMGLESYNHTVDIKWLGLCWTDIKKLNIPQRILQPMSEHDYKLIEAIERSGCLTDNTRCAKELKTMKKKGLKAEIQVLSHLGPSFLASHVITQAIRRNY